MARAIAMSGKSTVRMIELGRMWRDIRDAALAAVDRVGESGWFILGPEVERFEEELALMVDARFGVACASGTDAIELALRAADLQPGDLVATTPLSAYATTTGIVRAGGVPVYFDTDLDGNVDLEQIRVWAQGKPDPIFAVPVHLFGNPLNNDQLRVLTESDVVVVEDCAQALGASWSGQPVGSAGLAATYSFYPTKTVGAIGDAGAVATDSADMADRLRSLREYGQAARYVHAEFGLNSRMDEIQGAVLGHELEHLAARWLKSRTDVARRYRDEINHPALRAVEPDSRASSSWHLFPVFVSEGLVETFRDWLHTNGVESGRHYPVLIPHQRATERFEFETAGTLSNALQLSISEVSLPLHPYMADVEVERVIDIVNSWVAQ